jgi:translation initiation factor IF-2
VEKLYRDKEQRASKEEKQAVVRKKAEKQSSEEAIYSVSKLSGIAGQTIGCLFNKQKKKKPFQITPNKLVLSVAAGRNRINESAPKPGTPGPPGVPGANPRNYAKCWWWWF